MWKKIMSILLVLILVLSTSGFAKENNIITLEKGLNGRELTEEEISIIYNKLGQEIPKKIDKHFVGKIIDNFEKIKEEEFVDANGNKYIIRYYRYGLKNTLEGTNIQNQINKYKKENKYTSQDLQINGIPNPYEEGDVRVVAYFEPLRREFIFDSSTKNYITVFQTETYRKAFELLSGYFISDPIINFFTGLVLDDLLDGYKGKGDAESYYRLVHKYGQVYHKGSWKSYYDTYQSEWYWSHKQISYNNDGSVRNVTDKNYFPETYLPIQWIWTTDFYDDITISEVALYQYSVEPELSEPIRDFYRYEGSRKDWAAEGRMPY